MDQRHLSTIEVSIIAALLSKNAELRTEFEHNSHLYLAETIDDYGSLKLSGGPKQPRFPKLKGPIASGQQNDSEHSGPGVPQIEFILFCTAGRLTELQILKQDGSPVRGALDPEALEVW
jgi:hypothetical protein